MWTKCTVQKNISKHRAQFPALQSWWLTLPSSSASQDHWLRTLDTNLWLCSHKHGPNFLQFFGFPLCFLLEVGVLLLNIQTFLLWTTFSTDTLTITESLCNSENKRKSHLNKQSICQEHRALAEAGWLRPAGAAQPISGLWRGGSCSASRAEPTWVTYPGVPCHRI